MSSAFWVRGLILISVIVNPVLAVNSTIKLIFVISRHGERAPAPPLELYWNDPYRTNNFDPPGYGKLTKDGQLRELNLGIFLRKTYKDFLGTTYIPGSVEARSTGMNRAQESLKSILQGLYPGSMVPTKSDPPSKDVLLCPQLCPEYVADYLKAKETPEMKKKLAALEGSMKNLSKWTGSTMNCTIAMYLLYTTLDAEKSMNLTLPPWTNGVYPDGDLLRGMLLEFDIMNANKDMIKRNGGRFVKKIKEDMQSIRSGSMDKNRKLMLYVAFDLNIVAVLKALSVYYPHAPKCSSSVIIELHLINKIYHVKVNYYLGIPAEMKSLQIPGCETMCPLDKFFDLIKDVIPSGDLACDKVPNVAGLGSLNDPATFIMGNFRGIFSE